MDKAILGLVLVAGCYLPQAAPRDYDSPRAGRVKHVAVADDECTDAECGALLDEPAQAIQVRNVRVDAPNKAENASLGITISIPTSHVDCSDVLLAVVGARQAVLGERVVLTASWTGPVSDDGSDDTEPSLLWADTDMMTNLTVTGPATAEVLCDGLGLHEIKVELAPPAPCPATLQIAVECVPPK